MATTRDVIDAVMHRRSGPNAGSDLFGTIDSYALTQAEINAGVTPTNFSYAPLDVRRYGAIADWSWPLLTGTDNAAAFNNAIKVAYANFGGEIFVPEGAYRIVSALNFTYLGPNGNQGAAISSVTMKGAGFPTAGTTASGSYGGSWIVGNTGNWIADLTGAQNTKLYHLGFRGTGTGLSPFGLLFARSTTSLFATNNQLNRCVIWIDADGGASSFGSVAVVNNGAEQFLMDHCYLRSDTPYIISYDNAQDGNFSSVYTTIYSQSVNGGGDDSSSMMNHKTCIFQSAAVSPAASTVIYGGVNIDFDTCLWTVASNTPTGHGIEITTGWASGGANASHCQNIRFVGQCEQWGSIIRSDDTGSWNIKVDVVSVNQTTTTGHCNLFASCYDWDVKVNIINQSATFSHPVLYAGNALTFHGGRVSVYPNQTISQNNNLTLVGTIIQGINTDPSASPTVASSSVYSIVGSAGVMTVGNVLRGTAAMAGTSVSVTFPGSITLGSVSYQLSILPSAAPTGDFYYTSKSTTGFTINCTASFTGNIDWIATR